MWQWRLQKLSWKFSFEIRLINYTWKYIQIENCIFVYINATLVSIQYFFKKQTPNFWIVVYIWGNQKVYRLAIFPLFSFKKRQSRLFTFRYSFSVKSNFQGINYDFVVHLTINGSVNAILYRIIHKTRFQLCSI